MGDFTKRVQADKVPSPLRRGFTPHGWHKEFEAHSTHDDVDKNVYATGLAIHAKLQNIRSRLKLSTSSSLNATTKLRAFVAAVNHNFLVTRRKSETAIAEKGKTLAQENPKGFRVENLAAIKLELPGGFMWSPSEIVESLVDGIEIPVRFALAAAPNLAGTPRADQVEWNDISLELNLGIFYRHAEDLWNDCLWNGYKLIDIGDRKVFLPSGLDVHRAYKMGLARRLSLSIGFTAMATRFYRQMAAMGQIPRVREARSIRRHGKRQVISVGLPENPTPEQVAFLVSQTLASEPYYAELLNELQPNLAGLSIHKLLLAWSAVSRIALLLVESVAEKHTTTLYKDSPAHSWLPEYAPVLQMDALVKAVAEIISANHAEARRAVDFLTFRGLTGQEIWAQPLIPVGVSTLAPVFGAIDSPNLRRLVDVWMRQLGIDLARRGPAFEAHLRAMVQNDIATSRLLSGFAWSTADDYTFRPTNGREEQIDLIFVLGKTVIVAEAKCILEPTDSKAVAMHRRTVIGAANQATRKCQALEVHREEFVADIKRLGFELPLDFQALPLVIVSTTTHVGVEADGVPVVDEFILGRFLEGWYEDVAITGDELAVVKTLKTIFYSNTPEAEKIAAEYFSSPPQMERFKNGIRGRWIPVHAIDRNDWQGAALVLECVPDGIVSTEADAIESK